MDSKVLIIDLETTGYDSMKDSVVEIAIVRWNLKAGTHEVLMNMLTKPSCPIGFGAMGTHHITEKMVENSFPWYSVKEKALKIMEGCVPVAHNAPFERGFIKRTTTDTAKGKPAPGWIDTLLLSMRAWPNLESHALSSLRYSQGINMSDQHGAPHRACFDAILTGRVLTMLCQDLDVYNPGKLVELSVKPFVLHTCTFSDHYGKTWEQVARENPGLLEWVIRKNNEQGGFDQNVVETCRYWLGHH